MTFTVFTSNAGHSAISTGASSNNYKEHEQARLINNAFIKAMSQHNLSVTNTTSDARSQNAVLKEQVTKANKVGHVPNRLDLSFHLNFGGGTGVEVYYVTESGRAIAEKIAEAIHGVTGLRNRGAKHRSDLYFLNGTAAIANLIEVCFIDNKNDMNVFQRNRDKIADAVAAAVSGKKATNNQNNNVQTEAYFGNSLVDYLKSINIDSSFSNRRSLAVSKGIVRLRNDYCGTIAQNEALLKKLRGF